MKPIPGSQGAEPELKRSLNQYSELMEAINACNIRAQNNECS